MICFFETVSAQPCIYYNVYMPYAEAVYLQLQRGKLVEIITIL